MNIAKSNPTFVLLLGLCPALAITTSASSALAMGILTLATLMGSNWVLTLIHSGIPKQVFLLSKVIVIATFVSLFQLLIQSFLPSIDSDLGIYLPLIVVNCIVLSTFPSSALLALEKGLGFGAALLLLGSIREIFGLGTIFGFPLFSNFYPMLIMILPSGAFLLLAFILAGIKWLKTRKHEHS
jgi:electron transport complex protein RnfE